MRGKYYINVILCYIFFLIIMSNSGEVETKKYLNDAQLKDHILISADVKNYFRASSIFNIYNVNNDGMTTIFQLSRALSDNNVLVQGMRLWSIPHYLKYYKYRTLLPLYVVTILNKRDVKDFSRFSQNFTMSLNLWLVFFYTSEELLNFCKWPQRNIFNLAFDTKMFVKCQGDPVIREWYSIRESEIKVNDIALWSRSGGFRLINEPSMWKRRKSLEGITIRIATVKESTLTNLNVKRNRGTLYGLFGSALRELADTINFTAVLVSMEDTYGRYQPEHEAWSGVIGRLIEKDVDIGVAEFGRSEHRLEVVDFTVPLLLTRMTLYFRQPNMSAIRWSTYIQVFDGRIWMSSLVILISGLIIISFIVSKIMKQKYLSVIAEHWFYLVGVNCLQGLPEFPKSPSLKLAFISVFISSMVICICYSATLTSYLAVFTPSLPFSSEQEFLADTSYNLTVLHGSVYHDIFERAGDQLTSKMRERLKRKEDLPYNMIQAIQQVCNDKVVLCTNEVFVDKISKRIPCPILNINTGRLDSSAFTLTKGSPYKGILNHHIEKFRSYGIIKVLKNRHLQKIITKESKYSPVSFWSIVPILTIFFSGVCLSMMIFIFERAYYFRKGSNDKRRRLQDTKLRSNVKRIY